MAIQPHDLRDHPLRPAYLLYQALSTVFVRVPWWILINLVSRPRPSWTLRQAVMIRVIVHIQSITSRTGSFKFVADHLIPSKGPDIKQVWVEPASSDLFSDQLRAWVTLASVAPTRIPGYWIDKRGLERVPVGAPPAPGEKIGLFLHGGAYVFYSASPKDVIANIAKGILKHTPSVTRVLSLEYRLSKAQPSTPENAFPAALLDALAGYIYLVRSVGVAPEDVIVLGDSAGANLSHALTRYLVENANAVANLPSPPGSLLLLSPWVDITSSPEISYENRNADYIGTADSLSSVYARRAFLGPHGEEGALSRYISPASTNPRAEQPSFVGFPRTMIVAGGAEVLLKSIRALEERMRRDLGEEVTYLEVDDAVHDFLVFPFWEPKRTEALRVIAQWIERKPVHVTKL